MREPDHVRQLFASSGALAQQATHHRDVTLWVMEQSIELAWDLYRASHTNALRALFEHIRPFIDDLERRLLAGDAFGHQASFADVIVLWSETPMRDLERQALLRRALVVSPNHPNTRVCLAANNLRRANHLLDRLNMTWPLSLWRREPTLRQWSEARDLIDEAATLRPEHPKLDATRETLENMRQRFQL